MRTLAIAMLLCAIFGSISDDVYAQEVTGKELLELCSPQASDADHAICLGYIAGSHDTSVVRGDVCTPPRITHGQVRDIVLKFMLKHPEQLQEPAPHLIVAAVVEAFACH